MIMKHSRKQRKKKAAETHCGGGRPASGMVATFPLSFETANGGGSPSGVDRGREGTGVLAADSRPGNAGGPGSYSGSASSSSGSDGCGAPGALRSSTSFPKTRSAYPVDSDRVDAHISRRGGGTSSRLNRRTTTVTASAGDANRPESSQTSSRKYTITMPAMRIAWSWPVEPSPMRMDEKVIDASVTYTRVRGPVSRIVRKKFSVVLMVLMRSRKRVFEIFEEAGCGQDRTNSEEATQPLNNSFKLVGHGVVKELGLLVVADLERHKASPHQSPARPAKLEFTRVRLRPGTLRDGGGGGATTTAPAVTKPSMRRRVGDTPRPNAEVVVVAAVAVVRASGSGKAVAVDDDIGEPGVELVIAGVRPGSPPAPSAPPPPPPPLDDAAAVAAAAAAGNGARDAAGGAVAVKAAAVAGTAAVSRDAIRHVCLRSRTG
ncbi:hypothetical protein DFJ73DRAFT_894800 [Zopfochytrium polystomum]|nr:hypothetical protein DFJ73DRAFT_894800 [Zopfochytrium polystomum]